MITDTTILKTMGTSKSVLVIDDEKFSRVIVRRALHPLEVLEAPNGAEGLQAYLTNPSVAMILCDFNMPVMDGLKVLKAIRSGFEGAHNAVPILMLTGNSDSALVRTALQLDVDGFIVKPVSQAAIEARLKYVLTNPREIQPPKFYEGIDVESVSDRLLKTLSTEIEEEPTPEPEAITTAREIDINTIPPGSLLTRDINAPSGELLVAAGQVLSERLVRRLTELAPLGFAPKTVWIEDNPKIVEPAKASA